MTNSHYHHKIMNKFSLIHASMVAERNKLAKSEESDKADRIKALDSKIGRFAATFNDKISAKAQRWLDEQNIL